MKNHLLNEKGLTLIELLATLVLVSIISIFSFSLISSAIDSYRINQLNSEIRAQADLLFLTVNKEVTPSHFAKIKETISVNSNQNSEVSKLTISTTPFLSCPEYKEDLAVCTSSTQVIELKALNGQTELVIGGSTVLPSTKFQIDPTSTFVIDKKTQTVRLILKFNYSYARGNKNQNKSETFTQTFRPI